MIISNPKVYTCLQHEIDDHVKRGLVSSPILDEEARNMPYLQACIKEGLRRYPPITQLRERMAPPEGDTYQGHNIPPNTFIGLNAWGLQLNPVFGADADVFRPERWLEADPSRLKAMSQVQELVFGFGSTKCLGIPIATMNLNKVFVEVSRLACHKRSICCSIALRLLTIRNSYFDALTFRPRTQLSLGRVFAMESSFRRSSTSRLPVGNKRNRRSW